MHALTALLFTPVPLEVQDAAGRFGGEGPDLTRYFLICGVLLAGTAGVAWAFRRLISGAVRTRAARRSLQIVDVLPLGNRQKLCVVRCYDRTFALGVGDKEVSLVAELDAVEASSAPVAPVAPTPATLAPPEELPVGDRQAFARALERVRSSTTAGVASEKSPKKQRTGVLA